MLKACIVLAVAEASKVKDTCTLYQVSDDAATCGESALDCKYTKYAKLAEPGLKDGTCAEQGYTVKGDTQTKTYPIIGDIVITTYTQAMVKALDTCTLYEIADDAASCGESALDCKYTKEAKLAEPGLKDGTCAAQGFTVKGDTQTKHYPIIGDIVITMYTKAMLMALDTCTLYQIADDAASCGESALDCKYTKYAKLAEPGLKDGTCAAQGYSVKGDTQTKHYPIIGDIVITMYTKAMALDTCTLYEIADDAATCGESALDCKYTKYAKLAEPGLKDGTCTEQGYSVKGETQTKTYPIIGDIVITTYSQVTMV